MRKYLALIFMIIFSFQVLPLKVLGKMLAKGQTQEEEVKHDCSGDDTNGNAAKYLDYLFSHDNSVPASVLTEERGRFVSPQSDGIPPSYVSDILSPPPNC